MYFALGAFAGGAMVLGSLLISGLLDPPTVAPTRSLPPRLATLASWGAVAGPRFRPRRRPRLPVASEPVTAPPLPRRVPGAALLHVPDPPTYFHTNPLPRPSRLHLPNFIWRWWRNLVNRLSILESDESWQQWWADAWYTAWPSAQHGKHRREEREHEMLWRYQWASYDTQGWPTLSTSGNAWELLGERRTICDRALRTLWPEPRPVTRLLLRTVP